MKIAYFDCFAGISGDMTLGALIDAGADPDRLRQGLAGLGVAGYRIEVGKRMIGPISATDVRVLLDPLHGPHERRLQDILGIVRAAELSGAVKRTAEDIFRRLAEAEGRVHGRSPEEVHFHEVGAIDAIVDIVGSALCLEMLGWPKVIASPMPTFHGFAKGAHGVFPLPAPAAAELLRGVPWRRMDIEGELVTPTGAAIITGIASEFGAFPAMTVEAIGYGAGKCDLAIPDALRVFVGQEAAVLLLGREQALDHGRALAVGRELGHPVVDLRAGVVAEHGQRVDVACVLEVAGRFHRSTSPKTRS
mgnify:CR=1 FL=1